MLNTAGKAAKGPAGATPSNTHNTTVTSPENRSHVAFRALSVIPKHQLDLLCAEAGIQAPVTAADTAVRHRCACYGSSPISLSICLQTRLKLLRMVMGSSDQLLHDLY
jgi:hypothetical protein